MTPKGFLEWFSAAEAATAARANACALFGRAEEVMPTVQKFRTTPQGGPWHCEGPVVADHIIRILVGIEAIHEGASLLQVEEFVREKDLVLEIAHLERVIREHRDLLCAFALVHDLAKPATLFFDAKPETRGAAEGFSQQGRASKFPSAPELARYDKLYRAYVAMHPGEVAGQMAGFFSSYGIETHYYGHDVEGAKPDFAHERQAALELVGVVPAYAKLLNELVRQHISVLSYFGKSPDAKKVEVLAALAGRLGLNAELYLDLTAASMCADAIFGSIQSKNGKLGAQTDLVLNFYRAEREALPERHEERVLARDRKAKQAYKDALVQAGLSGDEVFAMLGTPIGPERGEIMARIQVAITDPTAKLAFGAHDAELARRIAKARELLAAL